MCFPVVKKRKRRKKGATATTNKYMSYVLCEVIVTCAAVWSTLDCLLVGLGLGCRGWALPPPPPTGSILPLPSPHNHLPPSLFLPSPHIGAPQDMVYPLPTAMGQGGWNLLLKDNLLIDDIIDSRAWRGVGQQRV